MDLVFGPSAFALTYRRGRLAAFDSRLTRRGTSPFHAMCSAAMATKRCREQWLSLTEFLREDLFEKTQRSFLGNRLGSAIQRPSKPRRLLRGWPSGRKRVKPLAGKVDVVGSTRGLSGQASRDSRVESHLKHRAVRYLQCDSRQINQYKLEVK